MNLAKIAGYGVVGCLITMSILILLPKLAPIPKRGGSRKLEIGTLSAEPERIVSSVQAKAKEPDKTGVERFEESILKLAPDLYHSVRLESLISKTDPTAIDSTTSIEAFEINVKGQKWDTMGSTDKVVIMNSTFSFLRKKFPYLTRTVRLIFDDGRPDLDLRFD